MSKYFVVDDIKVAEIMSVMLNERYYKFYNANLGHDVYSFIKRENIGRVYGKAKTIVESL